MIPDLPKWKLSDVDICLEILTKFLRTTQNAICEIADDLDKLRPVVTSLQQQNNNKQEQQARRLEKETVKNQQRLIEITRQLNDVEFCAKAPSAIIESLKTKQRDLLLSGLTIK